jgi:hypothetical protein
LFRYCASKAALLVIRNDALLGKSILLREEDEDSKFTFQKAPNY